MRKIVLSTLIASALAFPVILTGCEEADPNKFETHITSISSPDGRVAGLAGLERIVNSVAGSDQADRKKEFADKVLPKFAEIWDEAPESRLKMLELCRTMKRAETAPIWEKAIILNGTTEGHKGAILALQGIRDSNAQSLNAGIIKALEDTIASPSKDSGKGGVGKIRLEYIKTLGALGDKSSLPVLLKVLEQPQDKQPIALHKEAVKSLALIGDPSAVDAVIKAAFSVADTPTPNNIMERVKQALASFGDASVEPLLKLFKGENTAVNELASTQPNGPIVVKQFAASALGALGSPKAVDALVAGMPKEDCAPQPKGKKKKSDDEGPDATNVGMRAFIADALGKIGDPKAVSALCGCKSATANPGDLWPITEALGRIGGEEAFQCLSEIVGQGEYDPENLPNSDFRYEIRWEGARFMVLAASSKDVPAVRKVLASQTDATVKKNVAKWEPGIKLMEECKEDVACYSKALENKSGNWFAREKAAVEVSRRASGDAGAAASVAKAFKVRDAGARVTMALLTARMMQGKKCPECVEGLEAVMNSEKGNIKAIMQSAWLTALQSIAKLR